MAEVGAVQDALGLTGDVPVIFIDVRERCREGMKVSSVDETVNPPKAACFLST